MVARSLARLGRGTNSGLVSKGYGRWLVVCVETVVGHGGGEEEMEGGAGGGSQCPRVCRRPTPSPSWRPSALPRVRWRLKGTRAREVQGMATDTGGLRVPREFLPTGRLRRRLGLRNVQSEGGRQGTWPWFWRE